MSQPIEKPSAWLLPVREKDQFTGGLALVATPIGNMRDITIRALDTLAAADFVLCEDTRVSGKLLSYYGISKPLTVYNDHSTENTRDYVLRQLESGKKAALISDSGMPLVSDPGYKLVRACIEAGIAVTCMPGPSASLTGLLLSGLPSDKFAFLGFLPPKAGAREKALSEWSATRASLIAYETGPRLSACLDAILKTLGNRDVAVAREMTKRFEEVRRGPVSDLIDFYAGHGAPKGEIVLIISGTSVSSADDEETVRNALRAAMSSMRTKDAVACVAEQTGRPRKELYALALELAALDETDDAEEE